MKWILSLYLGMVASLGYAMTYPVNVSVGDISNLVNKLTPKLLEDLDKVIQVEDQSLEECGIADFKCDLSDIEIELALENKENRFYLDFAPNNQIIYNLRLPKTTARAHLVASGKIWGIGVDVRFDIEAQGLLSDPNLDSKNNAGVFKILLEDGKLKTKIEKLLDAKVNSVKVEPRDTLGNVVFTILDQFMDLEEMVREAINENLSDIFNSEYVTNFVEENINKGIEELLALDLPVEELGMEFLYRIDHIETGEQKLNLNLLAEIAPLRRKAECAKNLSLEHSFVLPSIAREVQGTSLKGEMPFDLITKALYVWFTTMQVEGDQEIGPVLCSKDFTTVEILNKEVRFDYYATPMGNLTYSINSEDSTYKMALKFHLDIKSTKFYPRIKAYHKIDGKKHKGIVVDTEISYKLRESKEGQLFLDYDNLIVTKIDGRFKAKFAPRLPGPTFSAWKYKDRIEGKLDSEFRAVLDSILLIDKSINVMDLLKIEHRGHQFTNREILTELLITPMN